MDTDTALAASKVNSGLMCCNRREWKMQARSTLVTCLSNDSEASRVTPSSLSAPDYLELHSAPGNVDASRDVQNRQALSRSKDHRLSLTRIQQQSVLHEPCEYSISAVRNY